MNEVKITYETLFDLKRREASREELQQLDQTFYKDVFQYIEQKESLLKNESSQALIFGTSQTEKAKLQLRNVKRIVKDIYESRERKIIRLAVNKSKTGSAVADTVAMLPEEKKIFNDVFEVLSKNRDSVLHNIIFNGKNVASSEPVAQKPAESEPAIETEPEVTLRNEVSVTPKDELLNESESESETEVKEEVKPEKPLDTEDKYEEKVSVEFTASVPKFVGKEMEVYGPFEAGDKADLPRIIANILLKQGKAESSN